MKNTIRTLVRNYIGLVAKLTINKHKPVIIAVVGNSTTSIAREVIYSALKEGLPTRRNLELPEAEFSIPLTILDYPNYPKTIAQWVWLLIKISVQYFVIKPYVHVLVLEMHPTSYAVLNYWLAIMRPQFIVLTGEIDLDYPNLIKVPKSVGEDLLEPYITVAKNIADKLSVDELDVELGLETLDFPEPRVRFWHSTAGGSVIDATYYYFPIRLDSILEIVEGFDGHPVCFTPDFADIETLKRLGGWELNPVEYEPKAEDVILLRGSRTKNFPIYQKYLLTHTPLI